MHLEAIADTSLWPRAFRDGHRRRSTQHDGVYAAARPPGTTECGAEHERRGYGVYGVNTSSGTYGFLGGPAEASTASRRPPSPCMGSRRPRMRPHGGQGKGWASAALPRRSLAWGRRGPRQEQTGRAFMARPVTAPRPSACMGSAPAVTRVLRRQSADRWEPLQDQWLVHDRPPARPGGKYSTTRSSSRRT